jgi:hypothetical protein
MDTHLSHYGVKGMKWGIRKRSSSTKRTSKSIFSKNKENNKASSKKKVSELSNEELTAKIERLNLEKRYAELAKAVSPPKSTRGKDFVLRVLERSGENIATQASAYIMGRAVNKLFERVFKDPSIVDPKNIQKKK